MRQAIGDLSLSAMTMVQRDTGLLNHSYAYMVILFWRRVSFIIRWWKKDESFYLRAPIASLFFSWCTCSARFAVGEVILIYIYLKEKNIVIKWRHKNAILWNNLHMSSQENFRLFICKTGPLGGIPFHFLHKFSFAFSFASWIKRSKTLGWDTWKIYHKR